MDVFFGLVRLSQLMGQSLLWLRQNCQCCTRKAIWSSDLGCHHTSYILTGVWPTRAFHFDRLETPP